MMLILNHELSIHAAANCSCKSHRHKHTELQELSNLCYNEFGKKKLGQEMLSA